MANGNMKVYVVDDDDAVRDSLEALLDHKGFDVSTFSSSKAFVEYAGKSTEPACLLLDIRMPDMDGIEVLTHVTDHKFPLAVVMITGHADVSTAVKAMKTGAVDFIEKPFTQEVILAALDKANEALSDVRPTSGDVKLIADKIENLSPRERDVLERLIDGLTNKEIARELDISPRTVEVYRAGVMDKMGARNLSALVKMGLAVGLGKEL